MPAKLAPDLTSLRRHRRDVIVLVPQPGQSISILLYLYQRRRPQWIRVLKVDSNSFTVQLPPNTFGHSLPTICDTQISSSISFSWRFLFDTILLHPRGYCNINLIFLGRIEGLLNTAYGCGAHGVGYPIEVVALHCLPPTTQVGGLIAPRSTLLHARQLVCCRRVVVLQAATRNERTWHAACADPHLSYILR